MCINMYVVEDFVIVDKLTTESLKQISFSRAKAWSKWMSNLNQKTMEENCDDAVCIDQIKDIYNCDDEELESDEDSECYNHKNVVEIAGNKESASGTLDNDQNGTISSANNFLALITKSSSLTKIEDEDRIFLSENLPVFQNYNRQLRKSRLDKALCTFDGIDKHGDQLQLKTTAQYTTSPYKRNILYYDDTDSDSIDTARYIRLSKKKCKLRKRCATKTTIIKSYRMVQRQCDELRNIYPYLVSKETTKKIYRSAAKQCQCSASKCSNDILVYSNNSVAQVAFKAKAVNTTTSSRYKLYAPNDSTLCVPECSFVNEKYYLTKKHLGAIIGEKYAKVFFRYYRGKRNFDLTSTVFYIPPKRGYYSGVDTSDSDIDPADMPDIGKIVEEFNETNQ